MKRGREYLKEIQRMMDYEKRRLERLEKAATSKRQMEQKVAKICSNPFATFQKEKRKIKKMASLKRKKKKKLYKTIGHI